MIALFGVAFWKMHFVYDIYILLVPFCIFSAS